MSLWMPVQASTERRSRAPPGRECLAPALSGAPACAMGTRAGTAGPHQKSRPPTWQQPEAMSECKQAVDSQCPAAYLCWHDPLPPDGYTMLRP